MDTTRAFFTKSGQHFSIFKIVQGRPLCTLCFPVNFAKFLRTPFFTEHLWSTASEVSMNMVKMGTFLLYLLMGILQIRNVLDLDVKTQDVKHVHSFLYINIFSQQLLARNIIFLTHEKPTLIANSMNV